MEQIQQEQAKQELKVVDEVKTSTGGTETPGEEQKTGKVEKKSGKRIGFNYIIMKSLKESQKNDVVKCIYIKSLINFGICVIKEGTYGDTKDREGRDIIDRLKWQKQLHEQLQDKVKIPRYLGSFEENGNYYLAIERIKGKSLYNACRERSKELREALISGTKVGITFINYIIQIIDLLDALHQNKVIHRDASSNNFIIMPSGKVAVIDMELSYSLDQQFPSPPFQLGTHGFMSPQQESQQPPSIKDDIFSIGAIIFQIWSGGISPSKITDSPFQELSNKVSFFVPDADFANMIIQCLHPEGEKRPLASTIKQVVINYKRDIILKNARHKSSPALFDKYQIIDTIQSAINTLGSPLLSDSEKGWFSENIDKSNFPDSKKLDKAWYASFSKGAAGVLYTLSKAKSVGFDTSNCTLQIQKALNLIEKKYILSKGKSLAGLYYGSSGIAASLSTAMNEKLFESRVSHLDWINQLITKENKENDYILGIAGQGIANWHCHQLLNEKKMMEQLNSYAIALLKSQKKDGSWITDKKRHKTKATRGFARGTAGIICFLLEYGSRYNETETINAAQKGLDWLMKIAIHRKQKTTWRSSLNKELGYGWSNGTSGIALTFIKAYALLKDEKYRKYIYGPLLANPKHILDNDLSQYDGLAGLGEIYLDAYTFTKDSMWLERAEWITQVIMLLKKEHKKYGPYWLVRHEKQPTSDFMNGNSGVIHFLMRCCHIDKIPFPLIGK